MQININFVGKIIFHIIRKITSILLQIIIILIVSRIPEVYNIDLFFSTQFCCIYW